MSAPPAPRSQHMVSGLAVTRRRPDNPRATVLLVHGAMDRAASFGRTMRRLGHHDVIAYDRRGYAGSIGAGVARDLRAHVEDLCEVAHWAEPENLVVVGHSLGGLLALNAGAGPLDGLPLKALGAFEAPMPWLESDDEGSGEVTLAVARREGPAAAAQFFYRAMVGDAVWQRLREADRHDRLAEGPALVGELAAARQADAAVDFAALRAAAHVARGELSSWRLRAAAAAMAEMAGSPIEEVAGAGHGAHLSHPDEFSRWVSGLS